MRVLISLILLAVIAVGIGFALTEVPFGTPKTEVGGYYLEHGREETGAANTVTSVVVGYRAFDTLGEVTVLFGTYVFLHGHLTPGGGFQGGAIIASACLLIYLGSRERLISRVGRTVTESLSGLAFVLIGLLGLMFSAQFLSDFLPKGTLNTLFSAGIIPLIYIAVGFKVGAELGGVIDDLVKETG